MQQLKKITSKMYTICILLILSYNSIAQNIIEIKNNSTTYRVDTKQQPVDITAARNIIYTAQLAMEALNTNIADLQNQKKETEQKITDHINKVASFANDKTQLEKDDANFLQRLQNHKTDLDNYGNKVAIHNVEVGTHNALAPEQRSQANADKLNARKTQLDNWANEIDKRAATLNTENKNILARYDNLIYRRDALINENQYLKDRYNKIDIKLGEAYKQLEQLAVYAKQINKLIDTKNWDIAGIEKNIMNNTNERLKEKSNLVFDGNKNRNELANAIPPFVVKPN